MTVGELIDKLGEVPADTPVEYVMEDIHDRYELEVTHCEYDEERAVVVLS